MILNELSIRGNSMTREEINRAVSQLLRVCQKLSHEQGDRDFYYTEELLTMELTSGYTIHDWLQDSGVSQKEKAFFRTIINRKQLIRGTDFPGSELIVETGGGEKVTAVGCLAAYESESFVVSMDTSVVWQDVEIAGTYVTLEQEDKRVSVGNCCFEEQLALLSGREKARMKLLVSSGKELWEKRSCFTRICVFAIVYRGNWKRQELPCTFR